MNPFTNDPAARITALGEIGLIDLIKTWLGPTSAQAPQGIGDDCAVLHPYPKGVLATTDGVVFGHHFDEKATPEAAGEKLLKRNLSDIAAMGGSPRDALITLLLGPDVSLKFVEGFYQGLRSCAERYNVCVAGGDITSTAPHFFAAYATLLGETSSPISRIGGQAGDSLWVTGHLGGSLLGHHLTFEPRIPEGLFLSTYQGIKSLIDLTDGMAKDCYALFPPGIEAVFDISQIPISPAAYKQSKHTRKTPLEHAFCDGEDYELLFTLDSKANEGNFITQWKNNFKTPLSRIGQLSAIVIPKNPPQLRRLDTGAPLPAWRGYEHLRNITHKAKK